MEYEKSVADEVCEVKLSGKFTFADHTRFRELFISFNDDNVKEVVLNLEALEFVDSAALGLFLLLRDDVKRHNNYNLALASPMGQVQKMFKISRFYELFEIR